MTVDVTELITVVARAPHQKADVGCADVGRESGGGGAPGSARPLGAVIKQQCEGQRVTG